MKQIIVFVLFMLTATTTKAAEESFSLTRDNGALKGTMVIPEGFDFGPVALLIPGMGAMDRDGNLPDNLNYSLKVLADELAKNGIASLRYDKRGVGESKELAPTPEALNFDDYVLDAKALIDSLTASKQFAQIFVIGYSEGSLVGMIASQNNPDVSGFVSIDGAGRPADQILKLQLANKVEEVTKKKKSIGGLVAGAKNLVKQIDTLSIDDVGDQLNTKLTNEVDKQKAQAKAKIDSKVNDVVNTATHTADLLVQGKTTEALTPIAQSMVRSAMKPYFLSWIKYDPQAEIKKLDMPTLIVQTKVCNMVSDKDAEMLSIGNPYASKLILNSANFVVKEATGVDVLEQTKKNEIPVLAVNDDLVKGLVEFITPS